MSFQVFGKMFSKPGAYSPPAAPKQQEKEEPAAMQEDHAQAEVGAADGGEEDKIQELGDDTKIG